MSTDAHRAFFSLVLDALDDTPEAVVSVRVELFRYIVRTYAIPPCAQTEYEISDNIEDAVQLYRDGAISRAATLDLLTLIAASERERRWWE